MELGKPHTVLCPPPPLWAGDPRPREGMQNTQHDFMGFNGPRLPTSPGVHILTHARALPAQCTHLHPGRSVESPWGACSST